MKKMYPIVLLLLALSISGCATTIGKTPAEKRKAILEMKNDVLTELYRRKPDVKSQISGSPGYAVFSNVNINVILASFGGGYGVVLGLGAKDFRAVFVFHNTETLKRFIEHGWAFGAQTDAAAKASDKGAAVGGEIIVDNITIYQLTESGLALQATVKGTKYWRDSSLN
jgi:hypothetical protein